MHTIMQETNRQSNIMTTDAWGWHGTSIDDMGEVGGGSGLNSCTPTDSVTYGQTKIQY